MGRRRAAIVLSLSLGVGQLLVAAAYALAARSAGIEEFGLTVAVIAFASVLAGVIDYGLAAYLLRELAAGRIKGADARLRLFRRMGLVLLGAAVALVIAACYEAESRFTALAASAAVVSLIIATLCMQSSQVILRARGRVGSIAAALLADRVTLLCIVVLAVVHDVPMSIALPGAVIAGLLVDAFICVTVSKQWSWRPVRRAAGAMGHPAKWFKSWSGTRNFGAAAMLSALQQIDVTLLAVLAGARSSGEYGAVSRWTNPMTLPSSAVTQTEAANAAEARSTASALKSVAAHWWVFLGSTLGAVLVAALARPIAETVLGVGYTSSSPVLAILALAIIPTVYAQPLAMVLQNRGEDRFVAAVFGGGLLLRLAVVVLLAAAVGAVAAAVAVTVQQALILVVLGWRARQLVLAERS